MKSVIKVHSHGQFIFRIGWVAVWCVALLSLISCGSGGNGTGGSPSMASTGSNVVTGTMPMIAVASRVPVPDSRSFLVQLWDFLTTEPLAYAMSKGRVEVVGTTIKALPVGGGRFELIGVPDGPVTIRFTTPDGVTGTLTLNLPQGGGALVDLGTVIVRTNGRVEFEPSSENARFRSVVKARGKVSGLASPVSAVPTDGSCPTFVVAGLTFCFDQNTWFDPPVNVANPFVNSDATNNVIVEVIGEPTTDPTSHVFHARRVQRNQGAPAAVNEKIKVLGPITSLGQDTITLFGGTTAAPDAHAITFNTASAKFEPGALKQNLAIGLLVEVLAGPVTTDQTGNQSSVASAVKLVRISDERCSKGELLHVQGTISSLQPQSMTFGLNNDKLFIHIVDTVTRFDDPLTSFASLTVGQMVEVTALPPLTAGGPLQAVEVDLEDALGTAAIEVRGAISSLDTTKGTFVVAGITFCYNCNTVTTEFEGGVSAATLANGQFAEVTGTALSNGVSTALEVEPETDLRPSSCSDDEGRDDDNAQQ